MKARASNPTELSLKSNWMKIARENKHQFWDTCLAVSAEKSFLILSRNRNRNYAHSHYSKCDINFTDNCWNNFKYFSKENCTLYSRMHYSHIGLCQQDSELVSLDWHQGDAGSGWFLTWTKKTLHFKLWSCYVKANKLDLCCTCNKCLSLFCLPMGQKYHF